MPSAPLPPSPIITRWGTWIEACIFYYNHFDHFKNFILQLPNDAISIRQCKNILETSDLFKELQFINDKFTHLTTTIKFFQNQNIKLTEAFDALNTAISELKDISGEFGVKLNKKVEAIFNRNPDLNILCQLFRGENQTSSAYTKFSKFIHYFSCAPLTSCDVERSFSIFKDVLTTKRTSLTPENLEKTLIVTVNSRVL